MLSMGPRLREDDGIKAGGLKNVVPATGRNDSPRRRGSILNSSAMEGRRFLETQSLKPPKKTPATLRCAGGNPIFEEKLEETDSI
jgi:hypothetical protein